MSPYDIDGFGILEASERPKDPETRSDPVLIGDNETSAHSIREELPDSTLRTDPEYSTVEEDIPVLRDGIEVSGDHNVTAGRDIDQSQGKTEVRGNVYVTMEALEHHFARANTKKRSGRGLQDPEALQQLAAKYVPPADLLGHSGEGHAPTAWHVLTEHRVLLLGADHRDCGQFSAALRLGHELRKHQPGLIIREELFDEDSDLSHEELLVEHEPAVVLIDLRDSGESELRHVERDLVRLSNNLDHYDSYLILILPPEQQRRFQDRFPGKVHRLGKPRSLDVLIRHVGETTVAKIDVDTAATEQLENLWPPQVKAIADIVGERIDEGVEPETALTDALQHQTTLDPAQIREMVRHKQEEADTEWLALLLAAAVLENSSLEHIAAASDDLQKQNGLAIPGDVVPLLLPSPYTRLRHLEDWFDLKTRELLPHGAGSEVLRYFWSEHPELRTPVQNWLIELPGSVRSLERDDLEQIADRAAELATLGGHRLALDLAAGWLKTKTGRDSHTSRAAVKAIKTSRRSVAVRLMTTVAMDPVLGRDIRRQLWKWAQRDDTDLKLLTAETCAGIGTAFPRNALTRLKHLADSTNTDVRSAVVQALQQIGSELGASRFLRYLTEWFEKASVERLSLLAEVIDHVFADHSRNIDFAAAQSFWSKALATMYLLPEGIQPLVKKWLHIASEMEPGTRNTMIESLVQATGSNSLRIAHVQYASKPSPIPSDLSSIDNDPMTEVVHQLWTRLDEIDPLCT